MCVVSGVGVYIYICVCVWVCVRIYLCVYVCVYNFRVAVFGSSGQINPTSNQIQLMASLVFRYFYWLLVTYSLIA